MVNRRVFLTRQDISERKHAEQVLQTTNQRLLEISSIAVCARFARAVDRDPLTNLYNRRFPV
jgi:GGDEF domain-containing protein